MRQPGFYWVREESEPLRWAVAEWCGDRWFSCGWECEFGDNELEEIDERRIERCV